MGKNALGYGSLKYKFRNINFQFSLAQFNGEPVIEFPLNKHNCKAVLLADTADTVQINGATNIENAIEKIAQQEFTEAQVPLQPIKIKQQCSRKAF